MSRLRQLGRSATAQRLLRSGPARRLTPQLVAAQRMPDDVITPYAAWSRLERAGVAPLEPRDGAVDGPWHVAFVVPEFRRGSGGHTTIGNLVRSLELRDHRCSLWLDDPLRRSGGPDAFRAFFGPFRADVHDGFADWDGADIAVATGWQTVATVLLLARSGARAHLVQDEEPDFYPASAERLWAERAHASGLHCITAGTWLADRMRARGAAATVFDLGIDLAVYHPRPFVDRAPARVLFYARAATPRRAVPLGLLALEELTRRRPDVEVVLYGDASALAAPFPVVNLGLLDSLEVAQAYAEATVGLVLSLTNHSLVAQEMMACGLPAVELRTPSTEAAFGAAPVELAEASTPALADALERLLNDPAERARLGEAGVRWGRQRTWEHAGAQVEAGLRDALGRSRALDA